MYTPGATVYMLIIGRISDENPTSSITRQKNARTGICRTSSRATKTDVLVSTSALTAMAGKSKKTTLPPTKRSPAKGLPGTPSRTGMAFAAKSTVPTTTTKRSADSLPARDFPSFHETEVVSSLTTITSTTS